MSARSSDPITLSVDEARERILAEFAPLELTAAPLDDALGLVTTEPVVALGDLPPFDNSAMDGYALRSADTAAASDATAVTLQVIGQAPAGYRAPTAVPPGAALRIMTGAPIPDGADAVVRFEHVAMLAADHIAIHRPVQQGENIRPAGEDARWGEVILTVGTRIRANEIALLASSGHASVAVHRRPRVGVLVTGDEVIAPGEPLGPGQIWNSNGPMVAAQVRQSGGVPVVLGVTTDSPAAVRGRLAEIDSLDLLLTTGGISVGDFDVVKDVLREEGHIELWSLRIKPGKPLAFGQVGQTPVIGLPGNPVAAAVAFWQFGYPAVRAMLGHREVQLPQIEARLLDRAENRGDRRQFVRVRVEQDAQGYTARFAGGQGSAMLTSLAASNGLLVVPEACDVAGPGDLMTVQMPGWDLG
ncbi:MAG TPA: gephyrin-like molybdotransferase Glp [Thermomicrobiales bacterium]|nr:gephyrin-like molybdotransferase Glp [Thermomicrobiales bacterium]